MLNYCKMIAVFMLVILNSGCISQDSQRNVPVIRLPQQVVYSEDPAIYIVRPGDTLYSIAWRFGLDFRGLAQSNGIDYHYTIKPGQRLKITEKIKVTKPESVNTLPHKKKVKKSVKQRNPSKLKVTSQQTTLSIDSNREKKSVTKWIWPVKGKLVDGYSSRRGGNKGIDILTTAPEPVHAVADGEVVYSGEGLRGYGKLVIIKHNENFLSAYAYNSNIRVKEKDQIKVGEVIADTGIHGLYKNRLHLEIRYKGKPVNPLIYLRQ
ncbi:MAG TPA: LysM peptidoglycan-binding domain-containing protein [Aeromonadales bacterium]|nr:LysM peptidoglycan-binding domain-containing protein [Aeromonadales bacterium]